MFWCESPRDVVAVSGPDASSYLQSQLSQDLRPLEVGRSTWSFVLQPTGKVEVLVRVHRESDDRYVLDTDAGFGETLTARLARFKIRVRAEIEPLDVDCIAVRTDVAGGDDEAIGSLRQVVVGLDPQVLRPAWGDRPGFDVLLDASHPAAAAIRSSSARKGERDDLEADRIAAVWPAMGAEIEPGVTIPAETGVVPWAVSFTKGCYPGQELVERMDSRSAAAPRMLRRVEVAAGTAAGDDAVRAGEVIGRVTSVVGCDALAYVRRAADET